MRSTVVLLCSLLAVPAVAQEVDAASGRTIKYKERTELTFENLDVEATITKPVCDFLLEAGRPAFNPLLRLRENFEPELRASVDEVK